MICSLRLILSMMLAVFVVSGCSFEALEKNTEESVSEKEPRLTPDMVARTLKDAVTSGKVDGLVVMLPDTKTLLGRLKISRTLSSPMEMPIEVSYLNVTADLAGEYSTQDVAKIVEELKANLNKAYSHLRKKMESHDFEWSSAEAVDISEISMLAPKRKAKGRMNDGILSITYRDRSGKQITVGIESFSSACIGSLLFLDEISDVDKARIAAMGPLVERGKLTKSEAEFLEKTLLSNSVLKAQLLRMLGWIGPDNLANYQRDYWVFPIAEGSQMRISFSAEDVLEKAALSP